MNKLWIVGLLLVATVVRADELDLYRGSPVQVPARIMLLLDTSDSMSETLDNTDTIYSFGTQEGKTCDATDADGNEKYADRKICKLKHTLLKFIDADSNSDNALYRWSDSFEVGLAIYNSPGARLLAEVRPLNDVYDGKTHRQHLKEMIDNITLGGFTPLVGSYLDVVEYLTGGTVLGNKSLDLPAVWENYSEGRYKMGMSTNLVCGYSNNHVVILTDGLSFGDKTDEVVSEGATLGQRVYQFVNRNAENPNTSSYLDNCPSGIETDGTISDGTIFNCADDIASSLISVNDATGNVTGITTYTIAYSLLPADSYPYVCEAKDNPQNAADYLCNWAKAGGGNSFAVNDESGLTNALQSIGLKAASDDTFTATVPGVGVNQANRFSYLDDIYFSVFAPSDQAFWYGNLKKYKLGSVSNKPLVLDANNHNVDGPDDGSSDSSKDGFFDSDAVSYWFHASDYGQNSGIQADGANVYLGGAALRTFDNSSRRLYTTVSGNTELVTAATAETAIKQAMLTTDTTKQTAVLDWLKGVDETDTNNEWNHVTGQPAKSDRTLYGAPIHSAPVLVNYKSVNTATHTQLTPANQENLVFVSTNDGKLYAVDSATGSEKLAFIPEVLLTKPDATTATPVEQMYDAARGRTTGNLIYGLDSTWTVWRQDVNKDGNITSSSSNDFVYLFGGMRRGGRNYYSLDVTAANDTTPTMSQRFVLRGGVDTEFVNMGQTWSQPVLGLIKYAGKPVVVMIFGGGYDPVYDVGGKGVTTPLGAQLYIVAARERSDVNVSAGDVLWWASSGTGSGHHVSINALTNSIPSTVKTLDVDGDGFVDHIYVGDMGGQLLRFDINETDATGWSDLVSNTSGDGVLVASLGLQNNANANATDDNRRFFYPPSVALMSDNNGRYVGIAIGSGLITSPKDTDVDEKFFFLRDYKAFSGDTDTAVFSASLTKASEKLLGSPLIVDGTAYFSTYYWGDNAADNAGDQCHAQYGRAALYEYSPGDASITQKASALPQNMAGSITTLLQTIPAVMHDSTIVTPEHTDLIGWGGGPSGAIDLRDIDMGAVRKTRWKQCQTDTCP